MNCSRDLNVRCSLPWIEGNTDESRVGYESQNMREVNVNVKKVL